MQTTARGDNPYGGAAFAANVSGNPLQANALNAGVTASAGPDAASQLADLLNVYGATGKRLPTSMATPEELGAFTRSPHTSATELGVGLAVASEAAHNPMAALLGIPLKAVTRGLDVLGKARAQNEAERLASAITGAPDDALQSITDAQRRAAFSRQALASAIGGTALSGAQRP